MPHTNELRDAFIFMLDTAPHYHSVVAFLPLSFSPIDDAIKRKHELHQYCSPTSTLTAIPGSFSQAFISQQEQIDDTYNKNKLKLKMSASADVRDVTPPPAPPKLGTLRIHGPDSKGIVADRSASLFFQRIHFDYGTMHTDQFTLEKSVKEVCDRSGMIYQLNWGGRQ
jgi:hypothetical protein